MNRFQQAKNIYANAHKHLFLPLTYILISGDYLDHEDFDKDEKDQLLYSEWGVEPKTTASKLFWILVKIWFFTLFLCFKTLLGFGLPTPVSDDEDDLLLFEEMSPIRDKRITSGFNFENHQAIENCSFEGDFKNADFSYGFLKGCDLRNTDLRGVKFKYGFLTLCDFRGADLRGANFEGVELRDCDFTGANIEGANFKGVEGRGVKGLSVHIEEL